MQSLPFFKKKLFWSLFMFIFVLSLQSVVWADDIDEVRKLLKEKYYQPVSEDILEKPTIEEILAELDPYTQFFTKNEFAEFIKAIDMNYVGIGIIGEQNDKGVKVVYLFETGAAIHSDLQLEDIIIEVDGTSLTGKTIDEAEGFLLGDSGTTAHLKVFRPSTSQTLTININRTKTEIAPTVESAWLAGNIGYIRLNSFNEESVAEMKKAMTNVGDVDGWIIDIRDNGGGYLNVAQDVIGLFPQAESALIVEGKNNELEVYDANKQNPQLVGPIFLLINSESASASEILAGAIKDQKGATLYGQTTFGKGVAQSIFELSSGNILKMTVAQFFTPNGIVINEIGIEPDVETEIGEELQIAHRDMMLLNKEMEEVNGGGFTNLEPRNVEFAIKLGEVFPINKLSNRISLIQLGGKDVKVKIQPTSLTSFKVRSENLLEPNSSYLLKIDSGIKDYVLEFKTSDKIENKEREKEIFSDIKADDFFADSAMVLYNEGLLKGIGNGRFGSYTNITREQAAVFFTRILGLNKENLGDPGFVDVEKRDYFYTSIAAVKAAGIMNGKSKSKFGTGDLLTRGELAALLTRAFKLQAGEGEMPFTDVGLSPFKTDILKIYQSGLAGGTTKTTFSPKKSVTRGEFVTFLYRGLVNGKSSSNLVFQSIN